MADENIEVEIKVDGKDATTEVKKVTNAANTMGKQFAEMGKTISSGFALAHGSMAMFGKNSKKMKELQTKVQGAIALVMGFRALAENKVDWAIIKRTASENFSMIVTKANNIATKIATMGFRSFGVAVKGTSLSFKVLKGAIISTGIGALIVGLGMLIEAIISWTDSTDDQEAATERLNSELDTHSQRIDNAIDIYRDYHGVTDKAALKTLDLKQHIKNVSQAYNKKKAELSKLIQKYGPYHKAVTNAKDSMKNMKDELYDLNVQLVDHEANIRAVEKAEADRQEARDKRKAAQEKQDGLEVDAKETLEDILFEIEMARVTKAHEEKLWRLEQKAEQDIKELEDTESKAALTKAINDKLALDVTDVWVAHYDKMDALAKKDTKTSADNAKKKVKITNDMNNSVVSSMSSLASTMGAMNDDNKEMAALSAIMNTYVAINKTMASSLPYPANIMASVATGIQGFANVKKIYEADGGSGGEVGDTTTAVEPEVRAEVEAPSFNFTGGGAEPMRAYVVTDDMTNNQDKLGAIRKRATL
jgi:hypothetical protein